jgi:TP901 family phage tail tape measure protein
VATETLAVTLLLQANQYKREANQAATATGRIGTQAQTTGTATGKLGKQMGGLAQTAKFAVAGLAVGAVTKFGKDSVQAFLGFDDAMNQSLAIMGDVSGEMRGKMVDAAREVGKTTRISAEEAAEAYFFLASAGFDAEQAIAAMPQVAAFAQAGMFDMATATDLATDAQSALGLVSEDAQQNLTNLTRVTDVFVRANTLANTSVEQVAAAMTNKAGAAMRAVGIDIEEGTAVLAAFADQGVKGSEAGTQFAIVLRDLQTRALQNKDAFEAAGISVFDTQGEFRNFADIMGELEGRLGGMSDAQKKAELSTLGFTDKSIAALTVLLGTSDAIRGYETDLRAAGGTTQEVADKQLTSFQGKLDLLKGRVEDVQIAIGEGLVPILVETADTLLTVVEPLGDLIGLMNDLGGSGDQAGGMFQRLIRALPGGQILDLKEGFEDLWATIFDGEPVLESATATTEEAASVNQELADRLLELEPALGDVTTATGTYETSVEALKAAEERQANATKAARDAIYAKRDALRELHDPMFRMVGLNTDLEEAEKAVEEASKKGVGSPEYREAVIDRANVIADLQDTMVDLKNQGIDPTGAAARVMFEGLGIPKDVIDAIFAQFNEIESNFEGRVLSATISLPDFHGTSDGSWVRTGTRVFSQHGGIFPATRGGWPVQVSEAGSPEAIIPLNSQGIGVLASALQQAGVGVQADMQSGARTVIHIGNVYGWDDFVRKVRQAGTDIQRLGW